MTKALFQEDNIFGTNAILTYGPLLQLQNVSFVIGKVNILQYEKKLIMSPYTEHAARGLLNPTRLEGEVQFHQAQDQQVTTHK